MIEIKGLRAHYGPIEALHGLDVTVEDGKITALIGSNGAGKTTLLKSISGMVKRTGSIVYTDKETGKSEELINKKPGHMARMHIIHVPESRHIFPGLTASSATSPTKRNWKRSSSSFPACANAASSWAGAFPAANSRCWQWGAR